MVDSAKNNNLSLNAPARELVDFSSRVEIW